MKAVYVTEQCRFLNEPFKGMPKQLSAVRATVSSEPHDPMAPSKIYKPDEWRQLLAQDNIMYRYKRESYTSVTPRTKRL